MGNKESYWSGLTTSSNKRGKRGKYRSGSLRNEPVTIIVTTICSIAPRVNRIVTTIVIGSSPMLANMQNRYLRGFLQLFPKFELLFGEANVGTSSGYKRLPSALTKCPRALPLKSLNCSSKPDNFPWTLRA